LRRPPGEFETRAVKEADGVELREVSILASRIAEEEVGTDPEAASTPEAPRRSAGPARPLARIKSKRLTATDSYS
jgi:hypothetical protein